MTQERSVQPHTYEFDASHAIALYLILSLREMTHIVDPTSLISHATLNYDLGAESDCPIANAFVSKVELKQILHQYWITENEAESISLGS